MLLMVGARLCFLLGLYVVLSYAAPAACLDVLLYHVHGIASFSDDPHEIVLLPPITNTFL
jgi:hypothetical protein